MACKANIRWCFVFLVSFTPCSSIVGFSGATDTLLQGQPIRDGQTLISANQTFELGFFSTDNLSNRYVGIWYHKVRKVTPVWVANRLNPVYGSSGVLSIDGDGNLVIVDGRGGSFVVAPGSGGGNKAAVLADTGNLVVRDASNSSKVSWESFDHPTDTFLPGMKLSLEGGQSRLLTSWRSPNDPSLGDFSLELDPSSPLELMISQKGNIYWSSGRWNYTEGFSNLASENQLKYVDILYVSTDKNVYFTYSLRNDSMVLRLVMVYSGQLRQELWVDSTQDWISLWSEPRSQCDVYNFCGAFGACLMANLPSCQCLPGFQPASMEDWSNGNFDGGCVRKASLQCGIGGKEDGFLVIYGVKFPANARNSVAGTEDDCLSACSNNCSCTAFAFSDGCTLWHGALINTRELISEEDTTGNEGRLLLRLPMSELAAGSKGKKKKVIIVVMVSLAIFVLTSLLCLCFVWLRRHRGTGKRKPFKEKPFRLNGGVESKIKKNERFSESFFFHFSQIVDASDNFSDANKLGQGGFGPVYKGQLPEGQDIAIKRLSAHSGQGLEEFENEIKLIAQLQHRNLVRLLGYCIQGEEKILIYEYMPNKSLDYFLFDPTRRTQLDWGRRFHIIEGVAQGLLYLHKHSRLRIIHRDLKASNILLDGDMNPKISDFGLARIFGSDDTQGNTKRVVGTFGYMSPEYALEGLFSVKSDVFSFGVLLLEIVSGNRNAGFHQYGNSLNLLGYAWELWKADKWLELVDPQLGDTYPLHELSRCIQVALLCVQESAADRPTMPDIGTMLGTSSMPLPDPKQPAFCTVRIATEEGISLNDVTFSTVDGR